MNKFCSQVEGEYRIRPDHPVIVRFPIERNPGLLDELRGAIAQYQATLEPDPREVLSRYYFGDFARKVVGVGSVGTEAFILLLMGDRDDEPLFLQLKEAQESVLEPFAGRIDCDHEGERVVRGQRLIQAAHDPFLGWTRGIALDGQPTRDYYVRQLRDMKGSMDVPAMDAGQGGPRTSRATWARTTHSTTRWPTSRWPTPTRTSVTTRPWSTPPRPAGSTRCRVSSAGPAGCAGPRRAPSRRPGAPG
jgi:uncharacterized protein (DUF2252 family)